MRVAILGSGRQGVACAFDLALNPNITEITLADRDENQLNHALETVRQALKSIPETHPLFKRYVQNQPRSITPASKLAHQVNVVGKVNTQKIDLTGFAALVGFLRNYTATVSAVPYHHNVSITKAAIESQTHMIDMGGNTDIVFEQHQLDNQAKQAGITILPDCGLAPGMMNILAADAVSEFDTVDTLTIRTGGLPQEPEGTLNYQLFFSIEGLINEYTGRATVLREGNVVQADTLTQLERLTFDDEPFEAFITSGGLSTLPWTFEDKVKDLDYKTIRYPGHCHQIQTLNEMGLFSQTPIEHKGHTLTPRELFIDMATPVLTKSNPVDMVLSKVSAKGHKDGNYLEAEYTLKDFYDPVTQFTAMMRTTGFPVAIVLQMVLEQQITSPGVHALEKVVPTGLFMDEVKKRGISLVKELT